MKESKEPVQKRSIEKKKSLIKAAMKVFNEKGYYNTYIKDITKAAGISTGLFYNYFEDKERIYTKVVESLLDDEVDLILGLKEDMLKESNQKEAIKTYIKRRIDHLRYMQIRKEVLIEQHNEEIAGYVRYAKDTYMEVIGKILTYIHGDISQSVLRVRVLLLWNTLYMNILEIDQLQDENIKAIYIDTLRDVTYGLLHKSID